MRDYIAPIELIVRVVIKRDENILLCKPIDKDYFFLPGGHVEFGDSLEETLYKELSEETGIEKDEISNISLVSHLEQVYGDGDQKRHELNMIYKIDLLTSREIVSQEDHIEFHWLATSEIEHTKILPNGIKNYLY
jgi:ADP-ribose pyrophosphatase YjhB (NUDIX family)